VWRCRTHPLVGVEREHLVEEVEGLRVGLWEEGRPGRLGDASLQGKGAGRRSGQAYLPCCRDSQPCHPHPYRRPATLPALTPSSGPDHAVLTCFSMKARARDDLIKSWSGQRRGA
jgi:hypothetical protein